MTETTAIEPTPLTEDELQLLDAYWRAANYLSVAQIYLLANPLLREPLQPEHVKPRLLGHFGTVPGLNLLYAHLNRQIRARELSAIFVTGPGHGGPALVANAYLEGTYTERYPDVGSDERGLGRLFRQFSFPGGIPSHVAPEVPGSIHEGGELGYALVHAFGAAFDNPDLLVACVVGDGEAETGPLAASWHSNKFLNPRTDGAVLPILHLNGFKIANPTVLARIPERELVSLLEGYGWRPILVTGGFDGEDPALVHQRLAAALDDALDGIVELQRESTGRRRGHGMQVADARPPDSEGVDGAEGGRREAHREQLALAPGADGRGARQRPRTSVSSRSGSGAIGPTSSSTSRAGSCPSSRRCRPRASDG